VLIVEGSGLTASDRQTLQDCNVPTVWIENGSAQAPSGCKKMAIVKLPIQRDLLVGAVAQCLGMANGPSSVPVSADTPVAEGVGKDVKIPVQPTSAPIAVIAPRVVELFDVVQEADQDRDSKADNLEK